MNPKSLFDIILKVFGLFFIRDIILDIAPVLYSLFYSISSTLSPEGVMNVVVNFAVLAIHMVISYLLIFKTNMLLSKLELDRTLAHEYFSFESAKDVFSVGISSKFVLTTAFVIIGGILLVEEIPNFCKEFYYFYSDQQFEDGTRQFNITTLIVSLAKILIALLMIGDRDRFINLILGKSTNIDLNEKKGSE